ncbi:DUF624 domain-containing protein [Alkalibacterium olivapovliticus]|uniref:Putative membrane protein YesL n=1 Tax=Alkalibacterium olivapovliticus TaxID=99907 RepID=A0A2T0W5J2_9LACT|nr:DUF624 domain-containing protein [Alkalibacterium olivapovliticus]PRY81355.1 putative membrane protein YesL [Alkalibacterium olivapovliticus]
MKEKQSTDTLLYKITQYIYYFLSVNFFFLVSNSLFIMAFIFIPVSISHILFFTVALIPAGASITALFYTMGKLNRDRFVSPVKDYFGAYKNNFRQSTVYWGLYLIALLIVVVDILFVLERGWMILTIISLIVGLILVLSAVYAFTILSSFEVTLKNLVLFSVYLIFKYKWLALSHLGYLFAFGLIGYGYPMTAILFLFAVAGFYFMRNSQTLLSDLKSSFSEGKGEVDAQ